MWYLADGHISDAVVRPAEQVHAAQGVYERRHQFISLLDINQIEPRHMIKYWLGWCHFITCIASLVRQLGLAHFASASIIIVIISVSLY